MDALIETCVNLKIQKYNAPAEDAVDSALPSKSVTLYTVPKL